MKNLYRKAAEKLLRRDPGLTPVAPPLTLPFPALVAPLRQNTAPMEARWSPTRASQIRPRKKHHANEGPVGAGFLT